MNKYAYDGPVLEFDRCVTSRWQGTTYAPSKSKARSNLAYQYKKQFGRTPSVRITLPNEIILVEGKENVS